MKNKLNEANAEWAAERKVTGRYPNYRIEEIA